MSNIAFFVHYSKDNVIKEHTLYSLNIIRNLYDSVVIISNSKLSKKSEITLSNYCDKLIERKNIGYDFAAWRDGIKSIGWEELAKYKTVTLVNDTCLFPIFSIEETIAKFNNKKSIDFWGASIHGSTKTGMPGSNGPVPEHIQSYFMVFKDKVVKSNVFQEFWNGIKNLTEVNDVINMYETQLTKILNKQGFQYDAIYNPIHHNDKNIIDAVYQIPEVLIRRHFPFIKIKAINSGNIEIITNALKVSKSPYPIENVRIKTTSSKKLIREVLKKVYLTFIK